METPPTINCSADTNEVHPMLSLFSVSWNSENLFERRVTLIQNGRNGDLQILGRVQVGFSTQKHLLSWKVRSLSLAGAKTVYDTKKVLWTSRFYFFPAKKGLHCLLINAPSFLLKKTKMMLPRVVFFPIKWCRQVYKWGIKWSEIALILPFSVLWLVQKNPATISVATLKPILISSTSDSLFHRLFEIALAPCHTFIVLIGCFDCFVCGLRDDSYRTK